MAYAHAIDGFTHEQVADFDRWLYGGPPDAGADSRGHVREQRQAQDLLMGFAGRLGSV